MKRIAIALLVVAFGLPLLVPAEERTITCEELRDKIEGYWIGQLVGNYMGFPFENIFKEEPSPVFIDRYYDVRDADKIKLNDQDLRGFTHIFAAAFEGAWSDDDTDIEFVTLHGVEKYGLDIDYAEIAEMWKKHINRKIWVANRSARDLMEEGMVPPETGSKENNPNWFQIDPQLVNEIWSVFYPGMVARAVTRAEWGARITNDDWGTHATLAYAAMYSAAFFEKDVQKLVAIAQHHVPNEGPFAEGMKDVIAWHKKYPDWRDTRKAIHKKYWHYKTEDYEAPVSIVSSLNNGLCGIMAVLYGEGDFVKTTGIAVSAGYDCDNQGATCAGLIGVLHGAKSIPDKFTKEMPNRGKWKKPFNDRYINFSRDELAVCTPISEIIDRILVITEEAILKNKGRKKKVDGKDAYVVKCDF